MHISLYYCLNLPLSIVWFYCIFPPFCIWIYFMTLNSTFIPSHHMTAKIFFLTSEWPTFYLSMSIWYTLHFFFFFFFASGKAARSVEFSRPRTGSGHLIPIRYFSLLSCSSLSGPPAFIPPSFCPSLAAELSLPLSPTSSLVSSFSQSLSQCAVLWTTVPFFAFMCSLIGRFLTASHPVSVFKLWHCHKLPMRAVKHSGEAIIADAVEQFS